jgi:hypothetical protein
LWNELISADTTMEIGERSTEEKDEKPAARPQHATFPTHPANGESGISVSSTWGHETVDVF